MSFKRLIPDAHKRACRMIGYSLALLDERAMWGLVMVLRIRLRPGERAFLAIAALNSLDPDEFDQVQAHFANSDQGETE